jgi:PEP-CTERM motif
MQRSVSRFFLAATAAALSTPAWSATAFDMETTDLGVYPGSLVVVDNGLTLTVTTEGSPQGFVHVVSVPVPALQGPQGVAGALDSFFALGRFAPLRFSFDRPINSITFNFGDAGGDSDSPVSIRAFRANGDLVGEIFETYPAGFDAGKSLTLNFAGVSYYVASSGSEIGNPNSITWDISAVQAAVPEPASWALLIAGFGLTGAAMRRRRCVITA